MTVSVVRLVADHPLRTQQRTGSHFDLSPTDHADRSYLLGVAFAAIDFWRVLADVCVP